jgi:CheY-like chemotaxis protein
MFEILIVDDRKEFRTLFKSLLKVSDFNADVSEAEDGKNALVILGQKKFDCVILDYLLDDSIGLDVLRQIKSIQPDLPVLMISAYDKNSIEKEVLQMGADAFLSKDELSLEKLTQALIKILPEKSSDPDVSTFAGLEGMKILIVDDTPQNLDVLRKTLENKGLNISIAPNGKIALKLVSIAPPDLILLDVMMPVMDGFETCRELKKNDDWKNIPIIFITALTREEDFTKGFALGAVDYISKPFRTEEVLARVNTHLRTGKLLKAKDLLINQVAKKEIHLSILMDSMLDGLIVIGRNRVIRSLDCDQ